MPKMIIPGKLCDVKNPDVKQNCALLCSKVTARLQTEVATASVRVCKGKHSSLGLA